MQRLLLSSEFGPGVRRQATWASLSLDGLKERCVSVLGAFREPRALLFGRMLCQRFLAHDSSSGVREVRNHAVRAAVNTPMQGGARVQPMSRECAARHA